MNDSIGLIPHLTGNKAEHPHRPITLNSSHKAQTTRPLKISPHFGSAAGRKEKKIMSAIWIDPFFALALGHRLFLLFSKFPWRPPPAGMTCSAITSDDFPCACVTVSAVGNEAVYAEVAGRARWLQGFPASLVLAAAMLLDYGVLVFYSVVGSDLSQCMPTQKESPVSSAV
jgi:hypothetical protein